MSDNKKTNPPVGGEIEEVKKQAEDYLNCWKRAAADYQNLKKETEKNQAAFAKFANLALIMEPILNNFKTAFNCIPEDQKESDWVKGVECIKKQFDDLMKNLGIEEIKTINEKFNPELHEAVGKEAGDEEDDIIIKETRPGYTWHGKVIMPAKVIVGIREIVR